MKHGRASNAAFLRHRQVGLKAVAFAATCASSRGDHREIRHRVQPGFRGLLPLRRHRRSRSGSTGHRRIPWRSNPLTIHGGTTYKSKARSSLWQPATSAGARFVVSCHRGLLSPMIRALAIRMSPALVINNTAFKRSTSMQTVWPAIPRGRPTRALVHWFWLWRPLAPMRAS